MALNRPFSTHNEIVSHVNSRADKVALNEANERANLDRIRARRKLSADELLELHLRAWRFVMELKRAAKTSRS